MNRPLLRFASGAITSLLFIPAVASADKLTQSEVAFTDGRYRLESRIFIAATAAEITRVITDFDALNRIDPRVTESRLIGTNKNDRHLVYSAVRDCVLVFCFTIERVEEVTMVSETEIIARAVPELSKIPFSFARWLLEPKDGGTWLTYELEIDPGIRAPRGIVKKRFAKSVRSALENIELLALAGE